ncbi:MAG: CheR family methyltransferase, partial [Candidatus Omnitrophota bacterium]
MESSIRPAFPPELQERLRYYISERSGLYFKDHDLKGLEGALLNRMASLGIDSALAYYTRLTSVEDREAELRELLNLLTVNHTYFLRNDAQFKALKQIILPEIIERKRRSCRSGDRPSLRIWSAGCSTGEEPYSIAMILDEVLTDPEVWDIQIIATDASTEALSRAGRGLYNRNSVKTVEPARLEKYFTEEIGPYREPAYRINDFLKKRVAFGFHNLMGEEFPVQLDVIFCRNVVIYFEFETTLKIMNRLHASLADEGYLAIGYSETLHYLSDKFRMVCWEEAIYYRKTAPGTVTAAVEATPAASDNQIDRILEALSREQVSMEIRTATAQQEPLAQNIREVLVEAAKCFHAKQYDRALALAQQAAAADGSAAEPYYLAAE